MLHALELLILKKICRNTLPDNCLPLYKRLQTNDGTTIIYLPSDTAQKLTVEYCRTIAVQECREQLN